MLRRNCRKRGRQFSYTRLDTVGDARSSIGRAFHFDIEQVHMYVGGLAVWDDAQPLTDFKLFEVDPTTRDEIAFHLRGDPPMGAQAASACERSATVTAASANDGEQPRGLPRMNPRRKGKNLGG